MSVARLRLIVYRVAPIGKNEDEIVASSTPDPHGAADKDLVHIWLAQCFEASCR